MGKRLFVGNLPFDVTDKDLAFHFATFGAVEYATVIKDRETTKSKGFGFVEMGTQQEADAAIAGDHQLAGRSLTVNEAKPKPNYSGGGSDAGRREPRRREARY